MQRRLEVIAIGFSLLAAVTITRAAPLSDFMKADPKPDVKVYKKAGGQELTANLFYPPGWTAQGKYNAIVWIHGGAWVAGTADGFFPHARYFAQRGAVGVSLNYRLLTPEGSTTLADAIGDVKSAIRYLRAHAGEFGIEPDRIAVGGDSAGGHLAACLGTLDAFDDPQDDLKIDARPNAMILCNPIVDMTEGGWLKFTIGGPALAKHPPAAATEPTAERIETARMFSPLFHVHPHQPPTLLMHGLDDRTVTPDQARQFAAAMTAAGNRCDLKLIEHARHAFIMPKYTATEATVVDAMVSADKFLTELGFLHGEPTLTVSDPPAWVVPAKKAGK